MTAVRIVVVSNIKFIDNFLNNLIFSFFISNLSKSIDLGIMINENQLILLVVQPIIPLVV